MAKIIVGMSGGVDSSVAALLLREAGHGVRGVFMKNYEPPTQVNQFCPWEQDQHDVQEVCERIGIPWESWNFKLEYASRVLAYFFREYQDGKTPNPDVMCNREIKFGLFLQRAKAEGYDGIATGHYARIKQIGKKRQLLAGEDKNKDQSYFLYTLQQSILKHIWFPIGHLKKQAVRKLAKEAGLSTANKPDSQGICFVGKVDVQSFLRERIPKKPGPIITTRGEQIGEHDGIYFYTIGQRHGLGVGGGVPYYVARKDVATNTLTVAIGNRDTILKQQTLTAADVNWISGTPPGKSFVCKARIRYRQPLEKCQVKIQVSGKVVVSFEKPQRAVTPGQSIVFYDRKICLGGGVICG
jgi:tRNA-specific 2-thiouridylase